MTDPARAEGPLPLRPYRPPEEKTRRRDRYACGKRHRKLVLLLEKYPNGLTDAEAAALLNSDRDTLRKYRMELAHCGLVAVSGTRKTDAHHHTNVWKLTAAGLAAARALWEGK